MNTSIQPQKFPSKIDVWLIVFVLFILFLSAVPMFMDSIAWIGILILILTAVFIFHVFSSTYYIVDGDKLRVKSSFIVDTAIDIQSIHKISESNNVLSSPAASLDRLEICYEKYNSVLVSPKDKVGFLNLLLKINPAIELKTKNRKNTTLGNKC